MYKEIYKLIEKYNNIVLARHVGVDPDAMASQIALRDAIHENFPEKKAYAVGSGSAKFSYLGKLDKLDNINYEDALLIVLDTPDKKRVDIENIDNYKHLVKIDHHPFVEKFCDIEYIDDKSSSTCQLVIEFLYETKMKKTKEIMEKLYLGLVADTNRFLFQNAKASTFKIVGKMMEEYEFDLSKLYQNLYMRPMNEIRLQGYISQNMSITDNGVGYIVLTDEILNKFKADASSAGNMVNNFNFIDEILVWFTVSEDIKNEVIKVSIRSRGPVINDIAEKYSGGGHKFASGARLKSLEEVNFLVKDLDTRCKDYLERKEN